MRDEPKPVDYAKVKTAALQALASGGDAAALEELERRGLQVEAFDVERADYLTLRALVGRWRDGRTTDELARSLELARRAQGELRARRATVAAAGWSPAEAAFYGPDPAVVPDLPPPAPWELPREPRCRSWRRPTGSTHYPSEEDLNRARFNALAREHYKAAGAPREEQ